jgi:type IV pilus assembly protein PilB
MEPVRVRLGELLVEARIISREQLNEVLALQATDGRRLGTLLVETGRVTETQVTQVLSQQLSVPWVSLYHIDFSRQLLNLVPREIAERHCLIPIFVRRTRGAGESLYIAMDDPTDAAARTQVEQYAGLTVRPMIAPPSDIRSAIRAYYGDGGGNSEPPPPLRSAAPPPPKPTVKAAPPAEAPPPPPRASEPPPRNPEDAPPTSRPVQSRETSMPSPRSKDPNAKMVTVTLLDGTQLNLPASNASVGTQGAQPELTARDLVEALRAQAEGADASAVLGTDLNWQRVSAALLSVLLRKHLIADWEFVNELRKISGKV